MQLSCSSLLRSSRRARTRITANERSLQDRNRDCTVTQGYAAPVPGYARPGLVEPTFQAELRCVVVVVLMCAQRERARRADPLDAFARGVLGGKYLIAVSARTVCARRIDSRPLSCRRCQEPPSTTCRALDRRRLGGSRHRRRNDSRARRASSTLAESRQRTFRSRWSGGTGLRHIPCGNDYNPAQSSTGRDRGRSAACGQLARTIAQAIPAS